MANGSKTASRQARQEKNAPKEAKSQLKSNAQAKTIKCKVCFQDFQSTTKKPELERHATNKHATKAYTDCFPE